MTAFDPSVHGDNEVDIATLLKIDDIGESRAKTYISGLQTFKNFLKTNELECNFYNTKSKSKDEDKSDKFTNKKFVFTGFRDNNLEQFIIGHGGKLQNNVTKNTYMLIYKHLDKYSKKIEDAKKYDVCVSSIDEFKTSNDI